MVTVSYSGLGMYDNCPSSFERKYILKEQVREVKEEDAPAMFRGKRIHEGIEKFLLGDDEAIPREAEFYIDFFKSIRKQETLTPEREFAFNPEWVTTSFHDPHAAIRGVIDAVFVDGDTCHVFEFKTGKIYEEHEKQRALYGLAALLLEPIVDKAVVTNIYIDQRKNQSAEFTREEIEAYKWLWSRRMAKVQPPQNYMMRPNWKCKWCAYSQSNGGTCPN